MQLTVTIIGWIGVVLCTLAYLLLSTNIIRADKLPFQALNILGGLCLAVTAIETNDLPNAAANILWMSIGLYALARHFRKRRNRNADGGNT